ncbi:MAG: DUF411 domain-containing protein [Magnetococcales bacterium]|nr:DUF411 domain-containing protein [Magnetococcales bacterium]NGZ26470.1 DUF411 domain-containing protein [Magnetococcales bacterium]
MIPMLALACLILAPQISLAADLVVYKSPYCGCCADWIKHMETNGFSVEVHNREDMDKVKKEMGIPSPLASCHTGEIGGYLVEGHVPAEDVRRLLKEKPEVKGIAVPGMPVGSPGMEVPGQKPDSYKVVTFTREGKVKTFSSH